MSALFNAVVALLESLCRFTGLNYFEINVLIYTWLLPASWWAITWWRIRKWHWLWLIHLGAPVCYCLRKEALGAFSEQFYASNTAVLFWIGGGTETGYILISIYIGLLIPALIYLGLVCIPKKWTASFYLFLIAANMGWYSFVCVRAPFL